MRISDWSSDVCSSDLAVSIVLENESGELSVPKNPVEDYVDYIAEGEGRWRVTTEGAHGGKKTHSSLEVVETIALPVPSEQQVINERQLELATDQPAPNRSLTATRIVADEYVPTIEKKTGREKW